MESGIYKITNTANGKYYLGSSKDITKRWRKHIQDLRNETHHSIHLQRAYKKYGEECFEFTVIENVDEEQLLNIEQQYLDELKPYNFDVGYNISPIASNCVLCGEKHWSFGLLPENYYWYGRHHTQEEKEKIGAAQRGSLNHRYGKPSSNKGKHLSEETKQKLSEAMTGRAGYWKGKKMPIEVCEKIRIAATGRPVSEKVIYKNQEWCVNISKGKKGKNTGKDNKTSKAIEQFNCNGELVGRYDTMTQAAKKYGVSPSCITAACQQRVKTSCGYIWQYAN